MCDERKKPTWKQVLRIPNVILARNEHLWAKNQRNSSRKQSSRIASWNREPLPLGGITSTRKNKNTKDIFFCGWTRSSARITFHIAWTDIKTRDNRINKFDFFPNYKFLRSLGKMSEHRFSKNVAGGDGRSRKSSITQRDLQRRLYQSPRKT